MTLSIVSGASVGVLISSNDTPHGKWHIPHIKQAQQPQVWMAIFSTIANSLLAYAFADRLAFHFWRLASRGTMVTQLIHLDQTIF
jgi:hypothetical protein